MTTLYESLGVAESATQSEIEAGWKKSRRLTHPDMTGVDSSEAFHRARAAYETLRDETRRAAYDKELRYAQPVVADTPSREPGARSRRVAEPDVFSIPYAGVLRNPAILSAHIPWYGSEHPQQKISLFSRTRWHWLTGSAVCLAGSLQVGISVEALPLVAVSVNAVAAVVSSMLVSARLRRKRVTYAAALILGVAAWLTSNDALKVFSAGAMAGFIAILLMCVLCVGFAWKSTRAGVFVARRKVTGWNVCGQAAANLVDSPFSASQTAQGAAGEKLTADLLLSFFGQVPNVRIFHSLRYPGSARADIDHVIVCGNKVAIVDSKAWYAKSVDYRDDGFHVVQRSGATVVRPNSMEDAAVKLRRELRRINHKVEVRSFTAVHVFRDMEPAQVSSTTRNASHVALSGDDLVPELGTWLLPSTGLVHRGMVYDLMQRTVL